MMPSLTWITLTAVMLLSTEFTSCSMSSQQTKAVDYEGDSICNIQASYNSPYVQAYRIGPVSSTACNSSSKILPSKSSSRKEVHVLYIRFPSNNNLSGEKLHRAPQVILNIVADSEDAVRNTDLVFVLASNRSITWKIISDFISKTQRLSFWVSFNSQLLPISGSNVKTKIFDTKSNVRTLRQWVAEKFKRVTTLEELNFQRKITRSVGLGANRGKACREQSLEESIEVTKGCIMPANQGLNNKDVHIIELEMNDAESSTIALNVQAHSKVPLRRHLLLVLKSHRPTKWVVLTSRLRGTLDIITDQTVDTNGIDMQSVRVVNEPLSSFSESKLVAWTATNYGAPASYTSAKVANRIHLTVDGVDENWHQREQDKIDQIREETLEQIREFVEQHQSVACLPGSMDVALLKAPLMGFKLSRVEFSLNDSKCLARENGTHFFWKTGLESCGNVQRHHGGRTMVENAILIQPGKQSVGDSMDDFSGSGMKDDDGSGYYETFSDYEDVHRSSTIVLANLSCSFFSDANLPVEGVDYYLQLYKDSSFLHEIISFPVVVGERQRLYVSLGSHNGEKSPRPIIHNCSIVPVESSQYLEYPLIINGCTVDRMTAWKDAAASQENFEFQIRDEWKHHAKIDLVCYVTICSSHTGHFVGVPQCTSSRQHCASTGSSPRIAQLQSGVAARVVRVGPLTLRSVTTSAFAARASQADSGTFHFPVQPSLVHDDDVVHDDTLCNQVIRIEGLESSTVVAIAFAAFLIGALLSGTLWYIHSRTGPVKKRVSRRRSAETSGESTPCSTAPITVCHAIKQL